ncbi:MAG: hypothetical protein HQM09_07150 [Candidatus Riflebacteria bacterium]|nr:hypothetical protein [Candidatus Riflebacteria bacterium]
MNLIKPRFFFIALLLLAMGSACQWTVQALFWETYFPESALDSPREIFLANLPQQLKSLLAGYCWVTADEYMHFGPSRKMNEVFVTGSYAGNTEIMPLLELAIILDPHHFEAYGIMSQNLAMYLNRYKDAIRLLQNGIQNSKTFSRLHELYAQTAFCYAFPKSYNNLDIPPRQDLAIRYLDAALKAYDRLYLNGDKSFFEDSPPQFSPKVYHSMKASFLLQIGREDEALTSWKASGLDQDRSTDRLSTMMREVERKRENGDNYSTPAASSTVPRETQRAWTDASEAVSLQTQSSVSESTANRDHEENVERPHENGEECNHDKGSASSDQDFSDIVKQMTHQNIFYGIVIVALFLRRKRR